MTFLIWILTAVLVMNCVLLTLLVLIQLPKKEAGAGVAFGGGATDALFGAGSGNALTKLTRYATITFLALSLVLFVMITRQHSPSEAGFAAGAEKAAQSAGQQQPPPVKGGESATTVVNPAVTTSNAAPTNQPAEAPLPAKGTN